MWDDAARRVSPHQGVGQAEGDCAAVPVPEIRLALTVVIGALVLRSRIRETGAEQEAEAP
jgi:hypothetical protein